MEVFGKDEILAGVSFAGFEPLRVDIGDRTLYVAKLTAGERDDLTREWKFLQRKRGRAEDDFYQFNQFIVAYCLSDSDNNRVFADDLKAGTNALYKWPTEVVDEVLEAIRSHNRLLPKKKEGSSEADYGSGESL